MLGSISYLDTIGFPVLSVVLFLHELGARANFSMPGVMLNLSKRTSPEMSVVVPFVACTSSSHLPRKRSWYAVLPDEYLTLPSMSGRSQRPMDNGMARYSTAKIRTCY